MEPDVFRCKMEVPVGRQHLQIVPQAKLGKQSVDRAELQTFPAAGIAQLRGFDVIAAIRNEQRQGRKALDDLIACTRP